MTLTEFWLVQKIVGVFIWWFCTKFLLNHLEKIRLERFLQNIIPSKRHQYIEKSNLPEEFKQMIEGYESS